MAPAAPTAGNAADPGSGPQCYCNSGGPSDKAAGGAAEELHEVGAAMREQQQQRKAELQEFPVDPLEQLFEQLHIAHRRHKHRSKQEQQQQQQQQQLLMPDVSAAQAQADLGQRTCCCWTVTVRRV